MTAILYWIAISAAMLFGFVLCAMLVANRDKSALATANRRADQWEALAKVEAAAKHRAINDLQAATIAADAAPTPTREGLAYRSDVDEDGGQS